MKVTKQCSECGGREIYTTTIKENGRESSLLPMVRGFFTLADLEIYICGYCGHHQVFVPEKYLDLVKEKYTPYE